MRYGQCFVRPTTLAVGGFVLRELLFTQPVLPRLYGTETYLQFIVRFLKASHPRANVQDIAKAKVRVSFESSTTRIERVFLASFSNCRRVLLNFLFPSISYSFSSSSLLSCYQNCPSKALNRTSFSVMRKL